MLQTVSLKKKIRIVSTVDEKVNFFVLQHYSGYGIYAGVKSAKSLIGIKDEYRELENDGEKLPIDYKYYKGLSFSS